MRQQTEIKPALTLTEKIQIISNSYMTWKDKIECMRILIYGEIEEKNKILNQGKIEKQIMSEVLYLAEKLEENPELARGYIYKRINLCWRNCLESGWMLPMQHCESGCEFLENLQKKQIVMTPKKKKAEEKKKEKKKKRNTGWHSRTWDRYNKFYCGITTGAKKQPAPKPKRNRLPIN
jgi:hypothetical protein